MDALFNTVENYTELVAYKIQYWLKRLNIPINYTTIDDAYDLLYMGFRLAKLNIMKRSRQNGSLTFTASTVTVKQKLACFGK